HATDAPNPPVRFEALGGACSTRRNWAEPADVHGSMRAAVREMWERTSLVTTDVDAALLYDGFTVIPLLWLQALRFCEPGMGGPFVATPGTIALGGSLPTNTDGGQLSGGRLHGYGLLYEACLQLRDQAGARQIRDAEVAVVTNGVGPTAGCVLLTR